MAHHIYLYPSAFSRWSSSSPSDVAQCPPLCSPHLFQPGLKPPSGSLQTTHGPRLEPAGWKRDQNQTDQHAQAGPLRGPQRKSHACCAPWLRIPFSRPSRQLSVWGSAADKAPPSGERGFEGGVEQLRSCTGYPSKDSWAVGKQPEPGQESALHGRLEGRSHSGGETAGRAKGTGWTVKELYSVCCWTELWRMLWERWQYMFPV